MTNRKRNIWGRGGNESTIESGASTLQVIKKIGRDFAFFSIHLLTPAHFFFSCSRRSSACVPPVYGEAFALSASLFFSLKDVMRCSFNHLSSRFPLFFSPQAFTCEKKAPPSHPSPRIPPEPKAASLHPSLSPFPPFFKKRFCVHENERHTYLTFLLRSLLQVTKHERLSVIL